MSKLLPFISNDSRFIRVSLRKRSDRIYKVTLGVKALSESSIASTDLTLVRNCDRYLVLRHSTPASPHHALFSSFKCLNLFIRVLLPRIVVRTCSPCTAQPRPERSKDFKKRPCMSILVSSLVILLNPDSLNDSLNFIFRSSKR